MNISSNSTTPTAIHHEQIVGEPIANRSSNSTTPTAIDLSSHQFYIGFGSAALITNVVVLIVLVRNKTFLLKSSFVTGLAIGDMINGLALIIEGMRRIDFTRDNTINNIVQPFDCIKGWTAVRLIGVQLPAIMMFLIGLERIIAIVFFQWYYTKWSNKRGWILTAFAYVFCAASIGAIAIVVAIYPTTAVVVKACFAPTVIGPKCSIFNYGLAIFCGMFAIICNLIGLLVFLMKRKKLIAKADKNSVASQKFVKKQLQKTTTMTWVALMDVVFVVVPNVFFIITAFGITITLSFSVNYWSGNFYALRSSLSLFIYLLMHREFRYKFLFTFSCQKNQTSPFFRVSQPKT